MISDLQLAIFANVLGVSLFLLVVLYHYVAVNNPKNKEKEWRGKERKNEERNEIIGKNDRRPAKENGFGEKKDYIPSILRWAERHKKRKGGVGRGRRKMMISALLFFGFSWFKTFNK